MEHERQWRGAPLISARSEAAATTRWASVFAQPARPFISTRERLRPSELIGAVISPPNREIRRFVPNRHLTFTTYGKGAFELAVIDAGLQGRKVLLPALIPHDFVGVFKRHGITPVFADVDPRTAHLDLASCTEQLLSEASAMILLHTFGLPANGAPYRRVADAHGLVMIEDCARALGAETDGQPVGWHADYAVYSLSKIAPIVRGGLLVSRRPIDSALPYGSLGTKGMTNALLLLRIPGLRLFEGPVIKRLRGTPVYRVEVGLHRAPQVAALDRFSLRVLDSYLRNYSRVLEEKRRVAEQIKERLTPLGFRFQADTGGHIYTALGAEVPEGTERNALKAHLKAQGINAFTLWTNPLGTSSLATELWGTDPSAFPVTARLSSRYIHFPVSRFITVRDIARIEDACKRFSH